MDELLPPNVVTVVQEVFGARGRRWLTDLPDMIDRHCAAWDLEVTGPAFPGGTHSYVARVRRGDGTEAVLKIPVVDDENRAEPTALRCYDGDGAIHLYEYDPSDGAMLLELADPGEPLVPQDLTGTRPHQEGLPHNRSRVDLACALYRRLWRVPESVDGCPAFPRVTDLVAHWAETFPRRADELGAELLPPDLLDHAMALCDKMSTPDGPEGIVNRDTHLGNIVSSRRQRWLLIDPKPFLGERAFDAGFLIEIQVQSLPDRAVADEMIARTAAGLGAPPDRARAWAFLRTIEDLVDDNADLRTANESGLAMARLLM